MTPRRKGSCRCCSASSSKRRTYGDGTAFRALALLQAGRNVPSGSSGELAASAACHRERLHDFGWKLPPSPGELWADRTGLFLEDVMGDE